jgi:Rrf2 family protein
MLNQSADYALRAVLYLAQGHNAHPAAAIAHALGIPQNYLGKILHVLAKTGVLTSTRGPRGGFRLAVDPRALTLAAVTTPFQSVAPRTVCLLGDRSCNPSVPCAAHRRWEAAANHATTFFRTTTIAAMLEPTTLDGAHHESTTALTNGAGAIRTESLRQLAAPARGRDSHHGRDLHGVGVVGDHASA